jgi:hypothetical protein
MTSNSREKGFYQTEVFINTTNSLCGLDAEKELIFFSS